MEEGVLNLKVVREGFTVYRMPRGILCVNRSMQKIPG